MHITNISEAKANLSFLIKTVLPVSLVEAGKGRSKLAQTLMTLIRRLKTVFTMLKKF